LLRSLLENKMFKAAFINRMAVLLQMNFESSRVLARINKMMSEIESEISRDQKRWRLNASRMNMQLNIIKDFAEDRPGVVYRELQDFFDLGMATPVTLSVDGPGAILVHGLKLDTSPLRVNFFDGFPVTLTAVPDAGGVWAGWSDGVMETTRTVVPGETKSLTAKFK